MRCLFYFLKSCDSLGKRWVRVMKPGVNRVGMKVGKIVFCKTLECAA